MMAGILALQKRQFLAVDRPLCSAKLPSAFSQVVEVSFGGPTVMNAAVNYESLTPPHRITTHVSTPNNQYG